MKRFLFVLLFLTVSIPMVMFGQLSHTAKYGKIKLMPGTITRAYVVYKSSSEITVKTGFGECNEEYWEILTDTDVSMAAVLPSVEDFLYVYIDDSASSYPTPTIIGSTTEPVWSDAKLAWYNGDDRCIGVVWINGSGVIPQFMTSCSGGKAVESRILNKVLVNTTNTTGTWQDLDGSGGTLNSSLYFPVNAYEVKIWATSYDDYNNSCIVYVCPKELHDSSQLRADGYMYANASDWVTLGNSRCVAWYTDANDDSAYIWCSGWRISR